MKKSMIAMLIAFSFAVVSCGGTKEGEAVEVEVVEVEATDEVVELEFAEEAVEVELTDAVTEVEEASVK